jgi:predicted MFS family arabinose efflux permease
MSHTTSLGNYATITANYWAFTLTDGALRMLVVLYFHQLGYSPLEIASLFLFYEIFGIVTNLVGGWLGSRFGLNRCMQIGTALQVIALLMLTVDPGWLSVGYVMAAQALSGIAKDLNKMGAKAGVKMVAAEGALFRWVAVITGSKNALKGAGFFLGGALLAAFGFRGALFVLAGGLVISLAAILILLPSDLGKSKNKPKFSQLFSKTREINWLSAARFFLFGARDVWFVVALPVYFTAVLGWQAEAVGSFFALWIIGYGIVQSATPSLLRKTHADGRTAMQWVALLAVVPAAIALALNWSAEWVLLIGLGVFALVFAINSALHSYLILAWSDGEKVASNVGFYYMANAGGRLAGTLLSGAIYQAWGLAACLWASAAMLAIAALLSLALPRDVHTQALNT